MESYEENEKNIMLNCNTCKSGSQQKTILNSYIDVCIVRLNGVSVLQFFPNVTCKTESLNKTGLCVEGQHTSLTHCFYFVVYPSGWA